MHKSIGLLLNLLVALALATSGGAPARAQGSPPAITETEAHAIAVDAYVYFYSLISIDVTRRQATNVEPGKVMLFGQPGCRCARRPGCSGSVYLTYTKL
jgi:hypothetical protein